MVSGVVSEYRNGVISVAITGVKHIHRRRADKCDDLAGRIVEYYNSTTIIAVCHQRIGTDLQAQVNIQLRFRRDSFITIQSTDVCFLRSFLRQRGRRHAAEFVTDNVKCCPANCFAVIKGTCINRCARPIRNCQIAIPIRLGIVREIIGQRFTVLRCGAK